ncbi:MAG TPA: RNA polymerase sigma factor SigJ [Polyangiaceae bacterium]|nr:RNA polymerase sigma factor SigJ [Polyangiaceae bacterium]
MENDENNDFERYRTLLMGVAYRMLGSSAEAEDAVQDAWLRWRASDAAAITNPRAWLTTTLVRLCIDRSKSARARRETYPGTWLPEPVMTTAPLDLESIQIGFLVLCERLDPRERAVFLLHQVFDYSHAEIGEVLGISEAASRQELHRAKKHVEANRPRFEPNRKAHERLLSAFVAAVSQGDLDAIASVVAEDVVLYGDHGEVPRGIQRPILGRANVARFFAKQVAKIGPAHGLEGEIADVNGWPALVVRRGDAVAFVVIVETDGTQITTIRSVLDPKKLLLREVN